jgi:predicted GNAT family N-acyltransferase
LKITTLDWDTARQYAEPIRRAVFIEEQSVPEAMEWDNLDSGAVHALAFNEQNEAVGYARLLHTHQLGRMAVLPEYRHRGVGTRLMNTLEEVARERHFDHIFLHAQVQALTFYERQGYAPQGAPFEEAGIPHLLMIKLLGENDV